MIHTKDVYFEGDQLEAPCGAPLQAHVEGFLPQGASVRLSLVNGGGIKEGAIDLQQLASVVKLQEDAGVVSDCSSPVLRVPLVLRARADGQGGAGGSAKAQAASRRRGKGAKKTHGDADGLTLPMQDGCCMVQLEGVHFTRSTQALTKKRAGTYFLLAELVAPAAAGAGAGAQQGAAQHLAVFAAVTSGPLKVDTNRNRHNQKAPQVGPDTPVGELALVGNARAATLSDLRAAIMASKAALAGRARSHKAPLKKAKASASGPPQPHQQKEQQVAEEVASLDELLRVLEANGLTRIKTAGQLQAAWTVLEEIHGGKPLQQLCTLLAIRGLIERQTLGTLLNGCNLVQQQPASSQKRRSTSINASTDEQGSGSAKVPRRDSPALASAVSPSPSCSAGASTAQDTASDDTMEANAARVHNTTADCCPAASSSGQMLTVSPTELELTAHPSAPERTASGLSCGYLGLPETPCYLPPWAACAPADPASNVALLPAAWPSADPAVSTRKCPGWGTVTTCVLPFPHSIVDGQHHTATYSLNPCCDIFATASEAGVRTRGSSTTGSGGTDAAAAAPAAAVTDASDECDDDFIASLLVGYTDDKCGASAPLCARCWPQATCSCSANGAYAAPGAAGAATASAAMTNGCAAGDNSWATVGASVPGSLPFGSRMPHGLQGAPSACPVPDGQHGDLVGWSMPDGGSSLELMARGHTPHTGLGGMPGAMRGAFSFPPEQACGLLGWRSPGARPAGHFLQMLADD